MTVSKLPPYTTSEPPEFHTEFSTPFSPLPLHIPEPSKIPVLRNQTDPIFNMTSTHIESATTVPSSGSDEIVIEPNQHAVATNGEVDIADDMSFSDPYDEQDTKSQESTTKALEQKTDVDDDYAMTFDSDGEGNSDKQDVSNTHADEDLQSPPATVPVSESLSSTAAASTLSNDPLEPQGISSSHLPFSPPTTTAGDATLSSDSTAARASETVQPLPSHSYEGIASGEIDIQQLLDNITATAELNASANVTPTAAIATSPTFPSGPPSGLPAHAGLPPRPQTNLTTTPMIMSYPPQYSGPPGYPQSFHSYRAPGVPGSVIAAGAPGTSTDPRNSLPPPPPASFNAPPSLSSLTAPPPMIQAAHAPPPRALARDRPANSIETTDNDTGEVQWGPDVQKLYDEFQAEERMYVSEGLWDRFPVGSRLFVGNLPTEKVTKRDLFYAFYKYGRLAQVSIKQAYGFVQFHDSSSCYNALDREQGQEIRGRKMHLEISKPQKNTRTANQNAPPVVTRRTPPTEHGRTSRGAQPPARGGAYDRYDSRSVITPREGDFRGAPRGRDDYRPVRSPSPPRGSYRGRDDYSSSHGRDHYDTRERRRSRSRSPYGRRDNARYRERSLSPRAREADEDADLNIPRRNARDVPEVQILLMEELDRGFIAWVDGELRSRGLKTDIMFLHPRFPLPAVIRRQILEGVLALSQLTRRSQDASKISLQVFDRKAGANNVRFDEYQDLEPKIAAELVVRAKQSSAAVVTAYEPPQFTAGQSYQPPPVPAVAPNLANLVGQLDNATLQQLLGTLNSNAPQQSAPPIDLAGILGGLKQQQQPPQQQAFQSQPLQNQYSAQPITPDLASLLGSNGIGQPQGQQSAQQVQNIMAQLARFRQ